MAALEGGHRHVQEGEMVGHEERVELRFLQAPDGPAHLVEAEIGAGIGAGIPPRAGMDRGGAHEGTEVKLATDGHHRVSRSS